MSANSKIEWCDHTFNPWIGCTKVSPGCTNCYAEARDKRHLIEKVDHWGKAAPRKRTSESNWKHPFKWNRQAPIRNPRVFCASLADWLDDEVPIEWLADLLALVHATPNLDWLLLTKRPENWRDRIKDAYEKSFEKHGAYFSNWIRHWMEGDAPENVWFGVSVEDQKRADERIPLLLQIPAKIRFLSCEPLLGLVDLTRVAGYVLDGNESNPGFIDSFTAKCYHPLTCRFKPTRDDAGIDWVICGGESGARARPMHPNWARSLRDQCLSAGVPFFFKQWGQWVPIAQNQNAHEEWFEGICESVKRTGRGRELNYHAWSDLEAAAKELPDACSPRTIARSASISVGKKNAGRLLDGSEWNEFPQRDVASISKTEAMV